MKKTIKSKNKLVENLRNQPHMIEGRTRCSVTFSCPHKNGKHWMTTQTFGRSELRVLAKVAHHAHTCIFEPQQGGAAPRKSNGRLGAAARAAAFQQYRAGQTVTFTQSTSRPSIRNNTALLTAGNTQGWRAR